MVLVVMGVSGAGKTTVGRRLAKKLKVDFVDGDAFHPPENVRKMCAGFPLTDTDRQAWLASLARVIQRHRRARKGLIVACSALKERYRKVLVGSHQDVKFIYLKGEESLIRRRLINRRGHFMPASLLTSQFQALEEPREAVVVEVKGTPEMILSEIRTQLGLQGGTRENSRRLGRHC